MDYHLSIKVRSEKIKQSLVKSLWKNKMATKSLGMNKLCDLFDDCFHLNFVFLWFKPVKILNVFCFLVHWFDQKILLLILLINNGKKPNLRYYRVNNLEG